MRVLAKWRFSYFHHEDAYGWVIRVKRYFMVNGVAKDEKLELVMVVLEGKAHDLYQSWEEHTHSSHGGGLYRSA